MRVSVVPYNPRWAFEFQAIRSSLETLLGSYNDNDNDNNKKTKLPARYTSIEHVGSTSIPSMPAKPIIDVDIIIPTTSDLQPAVEALTASGLYEYRGDFGIPGRWVFKYLPSTSERAIDEDNGIDPPRNVYVTVAGCLHLRNHLTVRNICREDAQVRQKYADVKLELSKREWESIDQYCEAKNQIISWMLVQAGMSAEDVREIRENNTQTTDTN